MQAVGRMSTGLVVDRAPSTPSAQVLARRVLSLRALNACLARSTLAIIFHVSTSLSKSDRAPRLTIAQRGGLYASRSVSRYSECVAGALGSVDLAAERCRGAEGRLRAFSIVPSSQSDGRQI